MNDNEIQVSFHQTSNYLVEIVFDHYLEPEIQFATFDIIEKKVAYQPELKLEKGKILKPLQLDLIKEGKILLPSSADGYLNEAKLIEDIESFINRYLDLPHSFYLKLTSHYVLLTWVYDKLSVVPYLRAVGDYGSGKTRFAQVVGSICYKPLFLAGATSDAFIFRMIELFKGTMIINELERVNTDLHSQIVNILNNGYEKGLYVGRVEGDRNRIPKTFDVFSPKIITSRGKFKDLALESRILNVPMRPTKRKDIPTLLNESFWDEAQVLRNKLLMYRFNNLLDPEFENKEEKLSKVEPRLKQTLLPLLYVVQNKETEEQFVKYALDFQETIYSERSFETEALVAEKLIDLMEHNQRVTVGEVSEKANAGVKEKEQLTDKAIGKTIREFGFKTKRVQGVYQITHNQATVDYLKDRYDLSNNTTEQSPLTLQSPPTDSSSEVDLVDKVDVKKGVKEDYDKTTEEAVNIFSKPI